MVRAAQAASFSLLHVGGSRLRKVSLINLISRSHELILSGYGDCFCQFESSSLSRVRRWSLSLHASHEHADTQRIRNGCSHREHSSNSIYHRNGSSRSRRNVWNESSVGILFRKNCTPINKREWPFDFVIVVNTSPKVLGWSFDLVNRPKEVAEWSKCSRLNHCPTFVHRHPFSLFLVYLDNEFNPSLFLPSLTQNLYFLAVYINIYIFEMDLTRDRTLVFFFLFQEDKNASFSSRDLLWETHGHCLSVQTSGYAVASFSRSRSRETSHR